MMQKENSIVLFNQKQVRRHWDEEKELWYFSIADVVAILTESVNPQAYWRKLKERLKKEGNETVTNCHGLKMRAADGKMRLTDVADTEQLLRIIQSIPSPKAEPFKLWLARVGYERIEETEDPELAFERAMQTYLKKGYSRQWINQRLKSIEVRNELTDEWQQRGVKEGLEYAILTDEITKAIKTYKAGWDTLGNLFTVKENSHVCKEIAQKNPLHLRCLFSRRRFGGAKRSKCPPDRAPVNHRENRY